MNDTRTSFYYDPARQGYDTSIWHTLNGNPAVSGDKLLLNGAATIHYGDCVRGEFLMRMIIPTAPAAGNGRSWGLRSINLGAYIYFNIGASTFSAETSDGNGNNDSVVLTWNTAWNNVPVDFRIRWEAGTAKFFINNTQVAACTDISITGQPLSLFLSNETSDNMYLSTVTARGIQFYHFNTGLSDSSSNELDIFKAESIAITESNTNNNNLAGLSMGDSISIGESVTPVQIYPLSVADAVSIVSALPVVTVA